MYRYLLVAFFGMTIITKDWIIMYVINILINKSKQLFIKLKLYAPKAHIKYTKIFLNLIQV